MRNRMDAPSRIAADALRDAAEDRDVDSLIRYARDRDVIREMTHEEIALRVSTAEGSRDRIRAGIGRI